MKRAADWFQNISLTKKLLVLIFAVGILPLVTTFWLSLKELRSNSMERQIYAINQGYEQVYLSLQDRMNRVHNLSTLLSVNDTIKKTFKLTAKDMDLIGQLAYFENISSYSYSLELTFNLDNILYFINDDFAVAKNESNRYKPISTAKKALWYRQLLEDNGRPTWVSFTDSQTADGKYVAVTRSIWDQNDYSKPVGIIAILLSKKELRTMLINSEKNQYFFLVKSDGTLLVSNLEQEDKQPIPQERDENNEKFRKISLDGEKYYIRSSLIEGTDVYLISTIPADIVSRALNNMTYQMGMMYALVSCLLIILIYPLTKSITYRIKLLNHQIGQVNTGEMKELAIEPHTDEIGRLIISYNYMVQKMDKLMAQQFILGQEKTGAELKALQSQINPHFLYNTLDMINWMAQKNESDNIREVIQAMSRFYRLSLSKGKDIITIREEIKMCEAYMEIQKRRFKGRIRFEEEVQDEILDYLIPKITLQPFIENAIVHGICEKEDGRGVVLLTGWAEEGRICLSVTDDGQGMSKEDKGNSKGSQYGMENIEKRLSLFYGEKILIEVESSLGIGTCITIQIPLVSGIETVT
ncbi:cache domain-containing sensor histidine kinase [Anaerocolumna jejuensis]|uniref:cache domain-containing sensor histidine kinase n=1 Tax=Anaerocolumna jejuensis TaxID=259063 RepID=UPI003F7C9D3B